MPSVNEYRLNGNPVSREEFEKAVKIESLKSILGEISSVARAWAIANGHDSRFMRIAQIADEARLK